MRVLKVLLALTLGVGLQACGGGGSDPLVPVAAAQNEEVGQIIIGLTDAELQKLEPDQRRLLMNRLNEFRSLSQEQQNQVRDWLNRFNNLTPEQREGLRRRFQSLPPEQRARALERMKNRARQGNRQRQSPQAGHGQQHSPRARPDSNR